MLLTLVALTPGTMKSDSIEVWVGATTYCVYAVQVIIGQSNFDCSGVGGQISVGADVAVVGVEAAAIQLANGACREDQGECKQQGQDCYESAKIEPLTIESHCIPLESVLVLGRARRLLY